MMMPLEGLRVLDVSTILAGPLCCQILGDFGADVIKIEHPRLGDSMRGHGRDKNGIPLWWKEVSRNKRAVGLDLSAPSGAEVLLRLAAATDVMVESFRPGTLERWGLGPDRLREANPGMVLVRLTGWGQSGPYASRGDERLRLCHRPAGRAAYSSGLRARRQHLRHCRIVSRPDGAASP